MKSSDKRIVQDGSLTTDSSVLKKYTGGCILIALLVCLHVLPDVVLGLYVLLILWKASDKMMKDQPASGSGSQAGENHIG